MEQVPRRIYWLAVFAALAAGAYLAYRIGGRSRDRRPPVWAPGREEGRDFSGDRYPASETEFAAQKDPVAPAAVTYEPPSEAERAPTAEAATVAMMERPSSAVAKRFDGNGSAIAPPVSTQTAAPSAAGSVPVEAPRRRGLSGATLAGIAAAVGLAAIALGAWAVVLSVNADDSNDGGASAVELQGVQQVVSLLSKPGTERIPLQGSQGRIILVVGARGYGVLVLDGLAPAPAGRSYQAWVIRPNSETPQSAAVFPGSDIVVPLTTPVPPGAAVAITLERAGGVLAPTQTPKLIATRAT